MTKYPRILLLLRLLKVPEINFVKINRIFCNVFFDLHSQFLISPVRRDLQSSPQMVPGFPKGRCQQVGVRQQGFPGRTEASPEEHQEKEEDPPSEYPMVPGGRNPKPREGGGATVQGEELPVPGDCEALPAAGEIQVRAPRHGGAAARQREEAAADDGVPRQSPQQPLVRWPARSPERAGGAAGEHRKEEEITWF